MKLPAEACGMRLHWGENVEKHMSRAGRCARADARDVVLELVLAMWRVRAESAPTHDR